MPKKYFTYIIILAVVALSACSSKESLIRFKAIYLDLDGTTLASNDKPRAATLEILERYRNCGGKVGIITGRTLPRMKMYLDDIKPNLPLVLYNGGVVYDASGSDLMYKGEFDDLELVNIILSMKDEKGVHAVFANYVERPIVNRSDPWVEEVFGKIDENNLCPNIEGCVKAEAVIKKELPIKFMYAVETNDVELVATKIRKVVRDKARVVVSSPVSVEILPIGVDKGITLMKVIQDEGLKPDDVAIFGDSGNDTNMVGEFPVSMAMGNCRQSTCDAALFKIGNNDTDAIARVIERLVLLENCRIN